MVGTSLVMEAASAAGAIAVRAPAATETHRRVLEAILAVLASLGFVGRVLPCSAAAEAALERRGLPLRALGDLPPALLRAAASRARGDALVDLGGVLDAVQPLLDPSDGRSSASQPPPRARSGS